MAAKRTSNKKLPNKSDFIRAQPASMSTADVIAKAKAQGIKFGSSLVYMVRSKGKGRKTAAKETSTPAKSPAAKTSTSSKADFVRTHAGLSPKEVVAKAKAAGIKLTATYVYNVRGSDDARTTRKVMKQAARLAAARKAPTITRPVTTRTSAEDLLKAVGAELGLARAIEILQAERARIHAVMRG